MVAVRVPAIAARVVVLAERFAHVAGCRGESVWQRADDLLIVAPQTDESVPTRRVSALQAVAAVRLLMREECRGRSFASARPGIDLTEEHQDLALGAFSREVSCGDAEERLQATRALVWLGDRRVISPLIRALGDDEWDVRLTAASGLADINPLPTWALEPLGGALGDPDSAVRGMAARALAQIPSPAASEMLVPALDDCSRTVVLEAVWGLGRLGSVGFPEPGALEPLTVALLQQEDPVLAYAAFWALGWLPGGEPARIEFRLSGWGQRVWDSVVR